MHLLSMHSTANYKHHKSSIKLPGGFGHSRGGLIREGDLFKKLDKEDVHDSFISLLPHILLIQHTTLGVKYINSTELYPKLYQN